MEQPLERLAEADQAEVVQRLDEEARVEQVPLGVVDAADVLVDRHPVVDETPLERRRVVVGVAVAQEVPRRVDERVHRLRLAPAGTAALRAGDVDPVRVRSERRHTLRLVVLDVRQEQRQLVVGHRYEPAAVAVDDRDRAAPVALAREAPVAQPEVDRRLAASTLAQRLDDRTLRLLPRQAVELPRGDQLPALVDHRHDRQVELLGELAVALVVRAAPP